MRFALVPALLLALVPAAAATTSRTAHVTVPSRSPVSVRGTAFRAHERVLVTVSARSTRAKTVTANARGRFRTTFSGFSIDYCDAYTVRARGSRGSVAMLEVTPECPNAVDPGLPSDPIPKKP